MAHRLIMRFFAYLLIFLLFVQAKSAPVVGNEAAADYFKKRKNSAAVQARKRQRPVGDHRLMFHVGGFLKDDAYVWGAQGNENIGSFSYGLSYQMGEWVSSTDFLLRIDFNNFSLPEGRASKMSVLPIATFPDAKSDFPIYFGAGLGAGIFYEQIEGESNLSLDYTLLAGVRLKNIFQDTGIFIESGVKNHVFLLSDGQFNSVFINAGTIFSF